MQNNWVRIGTGWVLTIEVIVLEVWGERTDYSAAIRPGPGAGLDGERKLRGAGRVISAAWRQAEDIHPAGGGDVV